MKSINKKQLREGSRSPSHPNSRSPAEPEATSHLAWPWPGCPPGFQVHRKSAFLRSCGKSTQLSDPGLLESCSLGNKSHHGDHSLILALVQAPLHRPSPFSTSS